MAQIKVEKLRKSFDQFTAVQGSNFTIEHGSFFAMLGPSGCGKTTTLRMIAGLELPTDGRVLLDGEDVTFRRAAARDIAFVFQLFALYPHMNVAENIGFPLKCQGMARREIRGRVDRDGAAVADRASADRARRRSCPAATGSGSRSAAPWSGGRRRF